MRYRLSKKLTHMEAGEVIQQGEFLIEILTTAQYKQKYNKEIHQHFLTRSLLNAQYCKADLLRDCVVGTFVIPVKDDILNREVVFGYYMSQEKLIFVDDTDTVSEMLQEIIGVQILDKTSVAHFFFEFMEYLIRDDVIFLQKCEENLTEMEEDLTNHKMEDFNKEVLLCRKELLRIDSYYNQLVEIGETLAENRNGLLAEEDSHLFHLFADRAFRLYTNVQELREYSLQIREMYQSQIDIRQNNVMQFLTVVTTIFMPLTLIVGWYGMNFNNMPELKSQYGYIIIILISILITAIQVWYFIRKKWFK